MSTALEGQFRFDSRYSDKHYETVDDLFGDMNSPVTSAQTGDELQRNRVESNDITNTLSYLNTRIHSEVMQKITTAIASRILPALEEIGRCKDSETRCQQLEVVRLLLRNLVSEREDTTESLPALTQTELRIAVMIKNGLKTAAIARLLYVSDFTVKTHRRNIRKKLGIINEEANLASTLKRELNG